MLQAEGHRYTEQQVLRLWKRHYGAGVSVSQRAAMHTDHGSVTASAASMPRGPDAKTAQEDIPEMRHQVNQSIHGRGTATESISAQPPAGVSADILDMENKVGQHIRSKGNPQERVLCAMLQTEGHHYIRQHVRLWKRH
jgi:hypothetical protein